MIKVISDHSKKEVKTVKARDMKPLEIGYISNQNGKGFNAGSLVMRSQSSMHFELMDLSSGVPGSCWTVPSCNILVDLLPEGKIVKLELSN